MTTSMTHVAEADIRARIVARRNFLLGLWAGKTIGHEGETLAHYAGEVMASDLLVRGPADIVTKVHRDFESHGVATSHAMILLELNRCEDRATTELAGPGQIWRHT